MSKRNKLNYLLDYQNNWVYRHPIATNAPEAKQRWNFFPSFITQAAWTMVVSDRLLLEAAAGAAISHWDTYLQPEVGPNNVRVLEQSTGRSYGMGEPRNPDLDERYNQRASMTYTTGSHTVKAGINIEELRADYGIGFVPGAPQHQNVDIAYTFLNQLPVSITQNARPYLTKDRVSPDMGIYAQDQWVLPHVTLNYGMRFDSPRATCRRRKSRRRGSCRPAASRGWTTCRTGRISAPASGRSGMSSATAGPH